MEVYEIAWSANDEDFNCVELSDLINDNPDLKPGDIVWKATIKRPKISAMIDVDDIIEQMAERAYDIGGEWSEDWMNDVVEHHSKSLKELLDKWSKELHSPTFYEVGKSEEYILTALDLEE